MLGAMKESKIFSMTFAKIHDCYVQKAEKKDRTETEVDETVFRYRIEDMEAGLMKKIRYADKLIDELARGKAMEKILRS